MIILKIVAIIAAWLLFYSVLKARNKRIPGIKATVVTLLFATLIFQFSDRTANWVSNKLSPTTATEHQGKP